MFKAKFRLIFLMFLSLCAVSVQAASLIPAAPQIAARAYVVMDADTGKVIAAKNADTAFPPASLTKLMTSYVLAYELGKGNISKQDLVLVSEKAWRTPGSRMFIREGTQVRLEDLMKGIVIQSGNDASVAVAEHIAGSERAFADLMNQHADLLGMTTSNFLNATGLPNDAHVSSAMDMAQLARAIIQRYPQHYGVYSEKYFTYNKIRQPNRNKLLWRDKTVDGLKTGHTDAAGYCLVASAKREGMRLISVVMGTRSEEARAQESQKLLSYGFRYYRTHQLYNANEALNSATVWSGVQDQLKVGLSDPLAVTIPRGQVDQLEAVMDIDKVIKAPVVKGEVYGNVNILLNGDLVREVPLVALEDIPEAGLLKRIWHSIMLFFVGLIG
ncbi:MAG: D-alanyl-D-alanine carboxypeptidase [Oceanospirillaceae bacterium]|nr:D-alanyl-D-alanine carboxypeptidase [Oceanospirillaceae bacterium]